VEDKPRQRRMTEGRAGDINGVGASGLLRLHPHTMGLAGGGGPWPEQGAADRASLKGPLTMKAGRQRGRRWPSGKYPRFKRGIPRRIKAKCRWVTGLVPGARLTPLAQGQGLAVGENRFRFPLQGLPGQGRE